MFNLYKVTISNYVEKVLMEMFRGGNIVDVHKEMKRMVASHSKQRSLNVERTTC